MRIASERISSLEKDRDVKGQNYYRLRPLMVGNAFERDRKESARERESV